jgi:hypothetical protein
VDTSRIFISKEERNEFVCDTQEKGKEVGESLSIAISFLEMKKYCGPIQI